MSRNPLDFLWVQRISGHLSAYLHKDKRRYPLFCVRGSIFDNQFLEVKLLPA